MTQPTHTHPYTIEPVTAPDATSLPAPGAEEAALLASIAELGLDVRVWA